LAEHSPGVEPFQWVSCGLCGNRITENHLRIQRLARCTDCGLIFVNPRPLAEAITALYDKEYFKCATPVRGGYENYLADEPEINRTFERRLARLERQLPGFTGKKLLDVGCAAGFFLTVAREHGWEAQGLEICDELAQIGRKQGFDVTVGNADEAEFPAGMFEAVTLWDVIEHLPNPVATLSHMRQWMAPGAHLVLTTPDAGSFLAKLLRSNWLGYRSLDEHLYFYSRKTIRAMLAAAGFRTVRIETTGKYMNVARIIERLRYYTRIGAALLASSERRFGMPSIYLNPRDTMLVVAERVD
jgi:2-polyprenyl-3-methyl-5-hydroxy-6-metoxy-1,4-benzoquinol methylase